MSVVPCLRLLACVGSVLGWLAHATPATAQAQLPVAAVPIMPHAAQVHALAYAPDGRTLASASEDETVKLWEVATGRLIRTFKGPAGNINSVAISPDGKHLLAGSGDRSVWLWEMATGKAIARSPAMPVG